ncbi:MAG: hypothetical protein QF637_10460 [Acidimicrobiales bacterium]|jgi:hypothetical protein|nr:hypothetical protein [Acidimicrobiales bacterium]
MKGGVEEMKIFQRLMQLKPDCVFEGLGKITEIVGYLNSNSDLTWYGWQGLAGMPLGTVAVSTRADSWAALSEAQAEILADETYVGIVASAAEMIAAPPQDNIMTPIAGSANMPAEPLDVLFSNVAKAPYSNIPQAMDWSQRFCEMANGLAGTPTAGLMTSLGEGGATFALLMYYESIAQYEERQPPEVFTIEALNSLQIEADSLFDASTNLQSMARRIA